MNIISIIKQKIQLKIKEAMTLLKRFYIAVRKAIRDIYEAIREIYDI